MRTLTAPASLVTGRTYTAPILLVTITPEGSLISFRFSDANRVIGGVEYIGLVQNPQDLTEALNDFDGGGAPATAQLVLFNDRPVGGKTRFSDLIQTPRNLTGTYDFRNAQVDIDRLETGHALADAVRLQRFYLEAPTEIGDSLITLQMSDLAQKIEDALPITKVSKTLFPDAPPSAINESIRRPFGTLTNVKAIPIQDGAATTLAADLTISATTITLIDGTDFHASGTALIESEFVTWTSKVGHILNGVTRAALSSTALAHTLGTQVLETRSEYVYVVGEGTESIQAGPLSMPIKSITNIRVNGHVARTTPTATADDQTLVPNRTFGTIRFTPSDVTLFHTLPQGQPQIISPVGHSMTVTGDGATNVADTEVLTPTTGSAEVDVKTRRTISWSITTTTAFTDANFWHLGRWLTSKGIGTLLLIGEGQGTVGNTTGHTWSGSHTIDYPTDGSETITFTSLLGSAKIIQLTFNEISITYDSQAGSGSTAQTVIGDVVCDVEGIRDDTLGTFTLTPLTLLENPAEVLSAILQALYRLDETDLNGTWTATGTIMRSAGYKWATLLDVRQFSELRRIASEQARARLIFASGTVGLLFRSYRPTADVTFQYDPAGGRTGLAQALSVKLTSPTESIAGLTVRYAYDDVKGAFQKSLTFGDATAASALPSMDMPFVTDEGTARDVGAYWYGLKRRQRFKVDGTAWHNALALEQGDHFAVAGHPALVNHGDDAIIFGLLTKTDRGGRDGLGRITLGGLEDTIEGDVGTEETLMAWGSRGLLAKNNAATPQTKIDVTANSVVLRNSSNTIVIRHNPGTLTVDLGLAGPIANGRDQAGAHTAPSWIHVYWIWDATNGVLALTSSQTAPPTGPAFPTNFTYWSYVGAMYFDGVSTLVRTTIAGSHASRATVEALAAAVTDNTEHSIDGTAIWPANAMGISGHWGVVLNVAGDSADLRAETGVAAGPHLETPGATTTGFGGGFRMNVTGQTIWYIQSANASRVWRVEIDGYELPNGG